MMIVAVALLAVTIIGGIALATELAECATM